MILFGAPTKYVHIKSTTVYAPRRNWGSPPTPHPQASVLPPPCFWGGGHSLARKGLGESQFRRGAYTVVLFICTYFVGAPYLFSSQSPIKWTLKNGKRKYAVDKKTTKSITYANHQTDIGHHGRKPLIFHYTL